MWATVLLASQQRDGLPAQRLPVPRSPPAAVPGKALVPWSFACHHCCRDLVAESHLGGCDHLSVSGGKRTSVLF